jgi:hypothetical protein
MKWIYIILTLFCTTLVFGNPRLESPGLESPGITYAGDTVIIKIGDGSEIVIVTKSKEELEKLSEYDLNAIIADLQESVNEAADSTLYLEMEDLSGEKYLKEQPNTAYGREPMDENLTYEERMERFEERMEEFEDKMDRLDEGGDEDDEGHTEINTSASSGVHFNKEKKNYGTSYSFNIDFGINNYLENGKFPDDNNALYAVKPFGSWNIALNWVNSTHVAGPLYLEWGPGVSWYNFKFDNTDTRILKTDDGLEFKVADPDVNSIKSKLVASYVNMSLVPMLDFGRRTHSGKFSFMDKNSRGFRFGIGGYGGYRIGSRTKFVVKDDGGDKEREKDKKNFYLNNWRYGLRFQMGYRGIDFYANYDLNTLFAEGKEPQLNAFSFGIVL